MSEVNKSANRILHGSKGKTLTLHRKVDFVQNTPSPRVMPPTSEEMCDVMDFSDKQLAEALRPVVLRNGHEYIGDPSEDLVAHLRASEQVRQTKAFTPLLRANTERLENSSIRPLSGIIGPDNRVVRRDNTEYPWSTILFSGCSGTMIGPSTALTAAHCVHNGTNWLTLPTYSPGSDFQDANPFPFGQFGCYTVSIPTAFINNDGGDARFDYAVVEFAGCGDFPGRSTGWKGIWVAPDSVITGNLMYVYGHPSDKAQPQIWGDQGSGILNGQYINFFIDAWFGDSGAGLYVYDTDGWPYVVGVLRGAAGAIGDDTRPNYGRRITQEVFDFIIANSEL
jgi:V8-like Glu-specific endopeptidase